MINLSPSGLKLPSTDGSNNLYQISSKDIKTGCANIKVKFVAFIYRPCERRVLECINPKRNCNISCIPSVI